MDSITPSDTLLFLGVALLILTYSNRLDSRQSISLVCGFTVLGFAKYLQLTRGKKDPLAMRVKQAGYALLLLSPSYEHWHDVFAVIGYGFCMQFKFGESIAPLAIYYILGAQSTTSHLSKVARALLGLGIMMGFKSPLQ